MFLGLRKLGNICCGHKMFLSKIRNFFCVPGTKFVSATNVARAGKRGNICVGNNASATMCPRLPEPQGHVTRSIFSCNLQRNKRCVVSCKKKFTYNTPFCNCNCCVASCKKSRTTIYFWQRCETSCLRVTSPLQLATQFVRMGQSELIFRQMSAT